MKIVADRDIPEIANAFAEFGDVELLGGREIGPGHLRDCRCLVVRSVTRVDAALLAGSAVEFVATATIGTDHVDTDYLASAGIGFANAAGCNAEAAAEYVIAGLFALSEARGFDPFARRAGIVGCGNVGSRVHLKLEALGIDTLVCDPPLAARGGPDNEFVDLDTLLRDCDLLTLHVPLTRNGAHPTRHLLDSSRLAALVDDCVLINAARGAVVDNAALAALLRRRDDLAVFLDTWEGEPLVSRELLTRVDLATPHIAGYSVEGRLRGTQMALAATGAYFDRRASWDMAGLLPTVQPLRPRPAATRLAFWQSLFAAHWDIRRDHAAYVAGAELDDSAFAAHFDALRRTYTDRFEYDRYAIAADNCHGEDATLRRLEFEVYERGD